MAKYINRIKNKSSSIAEQKRQKKRKYAAILGDTLGNIEVDIANSLNVWVTLDDGKCIVVRNEVVPMELNTPVWLGYDENDIGRLRVIGLRNAYDENIYKGIPDHNLRHQFGGPDVVFVWQQQIMPWNVVPYGNTADPQMRVNVYRTNLYINESYVEGGITTISLINYVPSTLGARFVLIQLEDDGTLSVVPGTIVAREELLTIDKTPQPSENCMPIASVRLRYGMIRVLGELEEKTDIADWRTMGVETHAGISRHAAGSLGQIQYNGGSHAFAASPNFTMDANRVRVSIPLEIHSMSEPSDPDATYGRLYINPTTKHIMFKNEEGDVFDLTESVISHDNSMTGDGTSGSPLSISRFIFEQTSPSRIWDITHNLNTFPNVIVVDSANTYVNGEISYTSSNVLRISFSSSFSGKAYIS